jgi:hypothetical protein
MRRKKMVMTPSTSPTFEMWSTTRDRSVSRYRPSKYRKCEREFAKKKKKKKGRE